MVIASAAFTQETFKEEYTNRNIRIPIFAFWEVALQFRLHICHAFVFHISLFLSENETTK